MTFVNLSLFLHALLTIPYIKNSIFRKISYFLALFFTSFILGINLNIIYLSLDALKNNGGNIVNLKDVLILFILLFFIYLFFGVLYFLLFKWLFLVLFALIKFFFINLLEIKNAFKEDLKNIPYSLKELIKVPYLKHTGYRRICLLLGLFSALTPFYFLLFHLFDTIRNLYFSIFSNVSFIPDDGGFILQTSLYPTTFLFLASVIAFYLPFLIALIIKWIGVGFYLAPQKQRDIVKKQKIFTFSPKSLISLFTLPYLRSKTVRKLVFFSSSCFALYLLLSIFSRLFYLHTKGINYTLLDIFSIASRYLTLCFLAWYIQLFFFFLIKVVIVSIRFFFEEFTENKKRKNKILNILTMQYLENVGIKRLSFVLGLSLNVFLWIIFYNNISYITIEKILSYIFYSIALFFLPYIVFSIFKWIFEGFHRDIKQHG